MSKSCQIQLSYERLEGLGTMYNVVLASDLDIDELVFAHAKELQHRLKKIAVNESVRNTLSLSTVECIALIRLWSEEPLNLDAWYSEVIRSITDAAHKFIANQRTTIKRL